MDIDIEMGFAARPFSQPKPAEQEKKAGSASHEPLRPDLFKTFFAVSSKIEVREYVPYQKN